MLYPLGETTVSINQELFSNLLSAASIPIFKTLIDNTGTTYSFYFLLLIHASAAAYFGTFDVHQLRQAREERRWKQRGEERDAELGLASHPKPYHACAM